MGNYRKVDIKIYANNVKYIVILLKKYWPFTVQKTKDSINSFFCPHMWANASKVIAFQLLIDSLVCWLNFKMPNIVSNIVTYSIYEYMLPDLYRFHQEITYGFPQQRCVANFCWCDVYVLYSKRRTFSFKQILINFTTSFTVATVRTGMSSPKITLLQTL
jgi:hypothetical protein